jgi:Trk K+ transport system NAD-binding subunit
MQSKVLGNIHRGEEILIPHGNTVIKPGDVIEVFGKDKDLAAAASLFISHN